MAMSIRLPRSMPSDCNLSRWEDIIPSSDLARSPGSIPKQMWDIHSPQGASRWRLASMREAVFHLRTAAAYPKIEEPSAAAPIMMA